MRGQSHKGVRATIRRLAARPEGCSLADVSNAVPLALAEVSQNARLMREVIIVGHRNLRRMFLREADAERYRTVELPQLRDSTLRQRRIREARRERERRAALEPKQPAKKVERKVRNPSPSVNIPKYTGSKWDEDTPAIKPAHVVTQVLAGHPGYDARYSLPPGTVVHGEFSRIPLGATLDREAA